MSKVTKTQTIVLVSYSTPTIPACFANSLSQHLLDNVMDVRGEAEEFVRVVCDSINGHKCIKEVVYQFGSDFYDDLADEVGELISEQMGVWMMMNNIDELTVA